MQRVVRNQNQNKTQFAFKRSVISIGKTQDHRIMHYIQIMVRYFKHLDNHLYTGLHKICLIYFRLLMGIAEGKFSLIISQVLNMMIKHYLQKITIVVSKLKI